MERQRSDDRINKSEPPPIRSSGFVKKESVISKLERSNTVVLALKVEIREVSCSETKIYHFAKHITAKMKSIGERGLLS